MLQLSFSIGLLSCVNSWFSQIDTYMGREHSLILSQGAYLLVHSFDFINGPQTMSLLFLIGSLILELQAFYLKFEVFKTTYWSIELCFKLDNVSLWIYLCELVNAGLSNIKIQLILGTRICTSTFVNPWAHKIHTSESLNWSHSWPVPLHWNIKLDNLSQDLNLWVEPMNHLELLNLWTTLNYFKLRFEVVQKLWTCIL